MRPSPRISPANQVLFFEQMEMLLSSGVLIADALASLKDRFPDPRARRVLREVHAQVIASRAGLSQALARFPRSFPPGIIAMVEAGEEGGSALLAKRFADLAERTAFEASHRRQIRRACAYPAFVLSLAAGLYALLLGVVFPRLAELLGSIGGQLPPVTRAVIAAAALFRQWGWPLAALTGIGALFIAVLRRHPVAGLKIDRAFLRLPVIGTIYQDSAVALICKIYRSLYIANQPVTVNLDLCMKLVGNRAFRHGLQTARRRIVEGGAMLSEALAESRLFPPLACLAIEVGERSGQIAPALQRVSLYFDRRARQRTETAIAVLNPLLTLFVVGGAGTILISFFQGAYQIVYATR